MAEPDDQQRVGSFAELVQQPRRGRTRSSGGGVTPDRLPSGKLVPPPRRTGGPIAPPAPFTPAVPATPITHAEQVATARRTLQRLVSTAERRAEEQTAFEQLTEVSVMLWEMVQAAGAARAAVVLRMSRNRDWSDSKVARRLRVSPGRVTQLRQAGLAAERGAAAGGDTRLPPDA